MEGIQFLPLSLPLHFSKLKPSQHTKKPTFKSNYPNITSLSTTRTSKKHYPTRPYFKTQPSKRPKQFKDKDLFPNSLPLHTKNPRAIYKDIQRFARRDKLKEALAIMDYMDQQGVPVNVTTFNHLIDACIRVKSLEFAKQVHVLLRVNNLIGNEFLRTKLVVMFASCGSNDDAMKVFDEMPDCRSVYTWNALLKGLVVSGGKKYREVLDTYRKTRVLGVRLNGYSFVYVLKAFAGSSALKEGFKVHALLVKKGLLSSSLIATCLVDLYFKCGKVRLAKSVFDEMPERDIVLWGAMVSGFARNGCRWEALDHVRLMVREGIYPNTVVLTSILPVLGEIWAKKLGQEVHCFVIKKEGYRRCLPVQCGLIDMYCKCGDMDLARCVFYRSRERNVVSWTALMSGYVSNGRLQQALRSVIWMQQEGFRPDVVTAATIIPVCADLRALRSGMEIHAYALKSSFLPNVSITTSLIKMYSVCGVLDYSVKLFNIMETRNVISWTAMIDSYVENGCVAEALDMFRSMQLSKNRPDAVVMARILNICGELKALKLGKEVHGGLLRKGFDSIPFVSSETIKMYGNCGMIHTAKSMFDAVHFKGSMTWTAIIEAYGFNRQWRNALELFDEMRSSGVVPTDFTFNVVLSICDQAGFVDDACRILRLMSENNMPSKAHFSIVTGLLVRSGRVEESRRFVQMSSGTLEGKF